MLPAQAGLNTNPQWAPDSKSLAFVSDRSGIANVFLYEFETQQHFQLTNVAGAISAITEYSPSISWARRADRLAFTYYDNGDYTIWQVNNPRALKKQPYQAQTMVALAPGDSSAVSGSAPVRPQLTIQQLLDSAELALPDTTKFNDAPYRVRFQPDYVARPSVGYAPDAYGRNVFGGTTVILSDMLGNHRVAIAGEVNGRIKEANMFFGYSMLGRRTQTNNAFSQFPYYFLSNDRLTLVSDDGVDKVEKEEQEITTYIARQLFTNTSYPLNRFSRFEFGGGLNNIGRQRLFLQRLVENRRRVSEWQSDSLVKDPSLNYAEAHVAYVSDNTLMGYTGPIFGRRYRLQVTPVVGGLNWMEYLADYRRYDAIIFNYLTLATRAYTKISVGPDEDQFRTYIARPDYVRGYDRNNLLFQSCPLIGASSVNCSATQLLGSRVAVANAELRFPLVRRFELGLLPIALPPLEGLFFYDAGLAWSKDQTVYGQKPELYDASKQRYPLRSYGFGLRLNLFNFAILRWDYAVPLDQAGKRGFWTWSLWPSY